MKASLKELIDELVTICLATSLEDATAMRDASVALDRLLTHDRIAQNPTLTSDITALNEKLKRAQHGKTAAKHKASQLLPALEELSHRLYTWSAEQVEVDARLNDGAAQLSLPPEVDAQIFGEFLSNAKLTMDDLEQEIESIRHGAPDAVAAVKRRIHTLKGESGMLGLTELEHILHCTETYLERPAPPWDRADCLLLVRDWVGDAINAYASMQHPAVAPSQLEVLLTAQSKAPVAPVLPPIMPPLDVVHPLVMDLQSDAARAQHAAPTLHGKSEMQTSDAPGAVRAADASPAARDVIIPCQVSNEVSITQPAVAMPDPVDVCPWAPEDTDLVVEFLHEVEEHLANVDQVLLETEQYGIDADRINKLFRAFHTLKGVASFLHLQQFKDLTHTTETMLDRIRSGQSISSKLAIDLVFDATAMLRELATAIQQSLATRGALQQHAGVPVLMDKIRRLIEGRADEDESAVPPAMPGERIGEILVRQGVVDDATVVKVLELQKTTGHKLGEELIAQHAAPAKAIAHALRAQQMNADAGTKLKEVVKVDLERVDNLVEAIGELVIVESMVSNAPEIRMLPAHLRNYLGQFAKITRELQELGMCMRMVPVRSEFQKMTRIMRDLARRSNKQVRMELAGEGTEMDRIMVEQIADPLVHLIRNAMDHGLEPAEERKAAGKPETGTVRLSACHEGGSIVIEISDDGRGINRERVLAKAVSQGIIEKNASLSDAQLFDLIFAPGFSTAQQVTEISGRGVGMDVVKRNIEAIRGRIITTSSPGRGTTFRLVLPLTLAIIDGMVIRCGNERFILPTLNIIESLQPTKEMLFSITGIHEHILVRGQTLPLVRLDRVLDVTGAEQDPTKALVIIVESLRAQIALLVDEVVMKQQVVIKTLSNDLDSSRLFAGAAILSNGRVGLIVNVESLIDASREAPSNESAPRLFECNAGNQEPTQAALN